MDKHVKHPLPRDVNLGAGLGELGRLLFQAFLGRRFFRYPLFRCKLSDVLSNFDELRQPANLALRVTLNVIYPAAPAQKPYSCGSDFVRRHQRYHGILTSLIWLFAVGVVPPPASVCTSMV
jgi:hypothetical protein